MKKVILFTFIFVLISFDALADFAFMDFKQYRIAVPDNHKVFSSSISISMMKDEDTGREESIIVRNSYESDYPRYTNSAELIEFIAYVQHDNYEFIDSSITCIGECVALIKQNKDVLTNEIYILNRYNSAGIVIAAGTQDDLNRLTSIVLTNSIAPESPLK